MEWHAKIREKIAANDGNNENGTGDSPSAVIFRMELADK